MSVRFEAVEDGFDLLIDDRLLLRHRPAAGAIHLALGNAAVTMVRGNFRMADAPVDVVTPAHLAGPVRPDGTALAAEPGGPPLVTLAVRDERLIVTATAPAHDRLTVDFIGEPGAPVWGGGEQMSFLALNGQRFPMWTSEPGVGREPGTPLTDRMNADGSNAGGDYWTTNYPQPTFLTFSGRTGGSRAGGSRVSGGHAVHVETDAYCELDFTLPARHRVAAWTGTIAFSFAAGADPAALCGSIGALLGRPPPLPDWAFGGAIIGLKDGANSLTRLDAMIEAGIDVAGVWCEDWAGIRQTSFGRRLFWDWQWNPARYHHLPATIAALKARGIRFLAYVNPYLAVDGPQHAAAEQLGYLARRLDSDRPYAVDFGEFDAGIVDFTNPAAAEWFAEQIIARQMIDIGIDGWMADFGEYLPIDLRLHDGDPMRMHNRWPVLWAAVNDRAIAARGRTGDILWFMRAGYSGVQRYCPLLWAGDQSVDFSRHDGIGTVITAALSSGLVGNPFSHSDVGGYTSLHGNVRTPDLLHRWFELGAFSPVMRSHEGNRPDDNLQIDSDPALMADFARWSRVHRALAPHVAALAADAGGHGLPAQRALFLHYPDDPATFTIQDQYLYGADLLIAPVITAGAAARRVYLPGDGPWRHLWSGADHAPGWHDIAAPIGMPPVFYRPDSPRAALFASLPAVLRGGSTAASAR